MKRGRILPRVRTYPKPPDWQPDPENDFSCEHCGEQRNLEEIWIDGQPDDSEALGFECKSCGKSTWA